ncbi:MAG: hypothetical protein ABIP64_02150, partial [Burkholderiales bacterium]
YVYLLFDEIFGHGGNNNDHYRPEQYSEYPMAKTEAPMPTAHASIHHCALLTLHGLVVNAVIMVWTPLPEAAS